MNSWPVQTAKARFSELLNACVDQGPQLITRRGTETAVLIPLAEWKRLNNTSSSSLKALLLSEADRVEFALPKRKAQRRALCAL